MYEMKTIGFFGFGLIGGSIARLLRTIYPDSCIFAYDRHPDYTNPGLLAAVSDGILTRVEKNFDAFSTADLIFLCAPVEKNIEVLSSLKPIIKENCILTDVGSVKGCMADAAKKLHLSHRFIGGHPMAGSEKTGYVNSGAELLENAYYILTPSENTPVMLTEYMINLIQRFHAIPVVLDAREHDTITAAISHVPHIIAASLVELVRTSDDSSEHMRLLAAGGFKDITRIASSSPDMWQSICMENAKSIHQTLTAYIDALSRVTVALDSKDAAYIHSLFENAGTYRSSIPNGKGMLNRIYELFMDISDEPGAIATIATLLASNGINIKNIGIIHNREFEQGVLRVEFYEEAARNRASEVLSMRNFKLYQR